MISALSPHLTLASRPPASAVASQPPTGSGFPVQADQFKSAMPAHSWVKGEDAATYRRAYSTAGAAMGAFASYPVMLGAGAAVGAMAGGLFGPIGAIGGGLVGACAGVLLQVKTMVGRQLLGRLGALTGALAGTAAHAVGLPLRSDHIEETKGYSYAGLTKHLGDPNYTSHGHLSEPDIQSFVKQLQPGDIVLTDDEALTIFTLGIAAVGGKADFNHAILYTGDGKTLEARTKTGVAPGDLADDLRHKQHAIAIRPQYTSPQQVTDTLAAGAAYVGEPYDFKFRMDNSAHAFYCSSFVFKALEQGAPQVHFKIHPLLTRTVVLPGDLQRTSQADVVAEAGTRHGIVNAYLAKFA